MAIKLERSAQKVINRYNKYNYRYTVHAYGGGWQFFTHFKIRKYLYNKKRTHLIAISVTHTLLQYHMPYRV